MLAPQSDLMIFALGRFLSLICRKKHLRCSSREERVFLAGSVSVLQDLSSANGGQYGYYVIFLEFRVEPLQCRHALPVDKKV